MNIDKYYEVKNVYPVNRKHVFNRMPRFVETRPKTIRSISIEFV